MGSRYPSSRSVAQGSASTVLTAITLVPVGPANRSIPTGPKRHSRGRPACPRAGPSRSRGPLPPRPACRPGHRSRARLPSTSRRLHRDRLVAQDHAGQRLDLDIGDRGARRLGQGAEPGLRKPDVLHVTGRDLLHRCRDFGRGQAKRGWIVVVGLDRQCPHDGVAPCCDSGKDSLDSGLDSGIILGPFAWPEW